MTYLQQPVPVDRSGQPYFTPVSIGDLLWFEFRRGLIIPVTVIGVSDVVGPSPALIEKYQLRSNVSLWAERHINLSEDHITVLKGDDWIALPLTELEDECVWYNQFVWINEPLGHAEQVGDQHCFHLTLAEAVACASVAPRRQRNRAHKKLLSWRKHMMGFIDSTKGKHYHAVWPEIFKKDKPVHVKR